MYGTTRDNRIAIHKPITVRSVNGPAFTVIEGQGPLGSNAVRCAYMTNGATFAASVEHCLVYSNTATASGGGAYSGSIRNSIISDNNANFGGGISDGSAENCTITRNSATTRGGTYKSSVSNSIVYYNSTDQTGPTYHNSCTPNPGGNNITTPPQFMDWAAGDYRLLFTSPCIDRGINQTWMIHSFDIEGLPRIIDRVDMGAYEYTYEVNDTPAQANAYQQRQTHTFYVPGDEDWIQFLVRLIILTTYNLLIKARTLIPC